MCFKICGDNPDEACGYPPKTIRAAISIFIVIISFSIMAFMACVFTIRGEYTQAMAIVGIISGELGGVIGYYFGSKQQKVSADDVAAMSARFREINRAPTAGDDVPLVEQA